VGDDKGEPENASASERFASLAAKGGVVETIQLLTGGAPLFAVLLQRSYRFLRHS